MKPNNPLNRETLLRLVNRSLDESSRNGRGSIDNGGTLGVAVRQIMATLSSSVRPNETDDQSESVNLVPVPLYDVAAFVDGTLVDPSRQSEIAEAAATDPGLMMEIVAAIRSRREQRGRSLPPELRSRLIAIQAGSGTAVSEVIDKSEEPGALLPSALAASQQLPDPTHVPTIRPVERQEKSGRQRPKVLNSGWNAFIAVVAAAVLFCVVGWWIRSQRVPEIDHIAEDSVTDHSPQSDSPTESSRQPLDQPLPESHGPDVGPQLVENPETNAIPLPEVDLTTPGRVKPPGSDSGTTKMASDDRSMNDSSSMAVKTPQVDAMDQPKDATDAPVRSPLPEPPTATKLVAEWNQVDGLLLRSVLQSLPSTSASNESSPRSVVEGSTFDLASAEAGSRVRLQTLPWCRATAKLVGGGELVMAADTQIELTVGGAIDLQHGSIALLGLDSNLIVRIGKNIANSIALETSPAGEVVIQKTVDGMQVDVSGQGVRVDGRSVVDSRLRVDETSMQTTQADDPPERLPRWTRQRVDRIEVGRNVLAQLSESADVRTSMMQSLRSGAVRGDAAMTLRTWIVAASHDDLLRLIGSQDALLREAVMQHLRSIDPTDPRHRELWQNLQRQAGNQRTFLSIRSYYADLWAQRRPNQIRRDQLLRMLQANDAVSRVAANYLLQNFYGPGPAFDMNANPATRTRMVNAWRAVISRVDQR
ncbi:MAG: hypothetical protein KDB00_04220 [Planctomycetales bacterium]|nr:hypothetical protein [Planctomycetales bacterium]